MCHLHKQLGLKDEPDLDGNLFISQRSSAALGPVCLEELGANFELKREWNITLIIDMTDYYLGKHFQAHIETLHFIDTGNAAQKCLLLESSISVTAHTESCLHSADITY